MRDNGCYKDQRCHTERHIVFRIPNRSDNKVGSLVMLDAACTVQKYDQQTGCREQEDDPSVPGTELCDIFNAVMKGCSDSPAGDSDNGRTDQPFNKCFCVSFCSIDTI